MIPKRIVAEITRNWHSDDPNVKPLLCQQFELVIAHNAGRGFELESWKLRQILIGPTLTETIIAVFIQTQ